MEDDDALVVLAAREEALWKEKDTELSKLRQAHQKEDDFSGAKRTKRSRTRASSQKAMEEEGSIEDTYRERVREIQDQRWAIEYIREESKLMGFLIGWNTLVNNLSLSLYRIIKPPQYEVDRVKAREKMDRFVPQFDRSIDNLSEPISISLEERLRTFGDHYVHFDDVTDVVDTHQKTLWEMARHYDGKGIIPCQDEELADFIYRGNTLLYTHRVSRQKFRKMYVTVDRNNWDVSLDSSYGARVVRSEDMKEANRRIMYYMDLSWVAGYIKEKSEFPVPALGVTFILPHYNSLGFIMVRSKYKSREKFLEVLSHEMTHAGTVYLDTRRDYLETKAYAVGKGSLIGEYAVAVNHHPGSLVVAALGITSFFAPWFPVFIFKYLPKVKTALQIAMTTSTFRGVQERLTQLYGAKGNYILGRLTGDEMEEFYYTNDIAARIEKKDNLKWRIMKENFAAL